MGELKKDIGTRWKIEGIALIITAILVFLVLLPVLRNTFAFPYMWFNVAAIFFFLTLARYIFLLRLTPFAWSAPVKIVMFFLLIPLIVYLMDGLSEFQYFLDEEGTYELVSHLPIDRQLPISNYIRTELIFFSVGAIIATIIFPFRLIISLWRVRNRNKV